MQAQDVTRRLLSTKAVSRSFTLLYTVSLLSLLTRIQLNLLGRRNYLSSLVSQASYAPQIPTINLENRDDDDIERSYGNDFETNRRYLTFSWWLLHRGWREIKIKVEDAVREVFGPLKPTEDITLQKLSELVLDVRRRVEGSTTEERRSVRCCRRLLLSLISIIARGGGCHTSYLLEKRRTYSLENPASPLPHPLRQSSLIPRPCPHPPLHLPPRSACLHSLCAAFSTRPQTSSIPQCSRTSSRSSLTPPSRN